MAGISVELIAYVYKKELSLIDPVILALSMIIIGQICLSVPLLLMRAKKYKECFPLALFLFANGLILMVPTVNYLFPEWYQLYSALSFPALFVLCPALWLYVEGITSKTPWQLNPKQLRHFILLIPGSMISVMMLFLSKDMHTAIFVEDADVTAIFPITLVLCILCMMLLWLSQCAYTIYRIVNRLIVYRKELKDWYSSHQDKQLNWMNWLLLLAVSTWFISLTAVFSSNLFDSFLFNIRIEALLTLILIWSLSHFGLQQKPGLNAIQDVAIFDSASIGEGGTDDKVKPIDTIKKYQRSALGTEQADRIAEKIKSVMIQDKLYLDANLSLQKLASHLAISPNYISQTLNETLNINFFDFVNQWRIDAAKPHIIENKDTVLNIAYEVGFNARSSFYKAFKQETGKTPSEFRKQHTC